MMPRDMLAYFNRHYAFPLAPWWPSLPPVIQLYQLELDSEDMAHWLDYPGGLRWYTELKASRAKRATPAFTIAAETHGGHFRDHHYKWKMRDRRGQGTGWGASTTREVDTWAVLKQKLKGPSAVGGDGGARMAFDFRHGAVGKAGAYDRLSFTGPDRARYEWRSNVPVSTTQGWRWDFQRNALFRLSSSAPGAPEGEQLVAEFAYWTGEESPGQVLSIRARDVDHAMVIATWNALCDAQWDVMRQQKRDDYKAVKETERLALADERIGVRMCYFRADSSEKLQAAAEIGGAAADIGTALAALAS
jgi:hypothetical protein